MGNPQLNFERFLMFFFADKVITIRSYFTSQFSDLSLNSLDTPISFYHFQHVSLKELCDLVNQMKITSTSLDDVPSDIIKATFPIIGHSI